MMMTKADAARWLSERNDFCILTHRKPDGDTVGSAAALCLGLRKLGKGACVLANPDLASRLLLYLSDNFREDVSLPALALRFGYSESYLSRYFKECFSIGLTNYVNLLRLRHATNLLAEKGRSVTDCALESGFGSMRSFYRIFSQEFGCSPKQWRIQIEA